VWKTAELSTSYRALDSSEFFEAQWKTQHAAPGYEYLALTIPMVKPRASTQALHQEL
jgi:hypothetical protein